VLALSIGKRKTNA
jgi:hypothetical protein